MRTVSVRDLQRKVRDCLARSQKERIIVARDGHPVAVLIGVAGKDWETVLLETDPAFWRMIQARRRHGTTPLRTVKKRLGL